MNNSKINVEGDGSQQCQKCLEIGHWSYQCKNPRVYSTRQSRTESIGKQQKMKRVVPPPIINTYSTHDIDTFRHKKVLEEKEKLMEELENLKRKAEKGSDTDSDSDSDSSLSTDSSDISSDSSDSDSDSDSDIEQKKKLKKME
eukprot:gene10311-2727_t